MLELNHHFSLNLTQLPMAASGGNPIILGLVIWIVIMIIAFFLLKKNKMTQKNSIILLLISFFVGGLIFGANPNPVAPFFEITMGLNNQVPLPQRIQSIMPVFIILGVLLFSGYFIGRIFCGFACPLGAIQELLSKLRFGNKARKNKNPVVVKKQKNVGIIFRWVIFAIYIIGVLILGASFAKITNPFLGFQAIKTKNFQMLLIPFILFLITIVASIFVYRPYCRYFCPYGAFASAINKGKKNAIKIGPSCKDCGLCDRVCPTHSLDKDSDKNECYYCGRCVEICSNNNSKANIDLLDNQKIADINEYITSAKLFPDRVNKEEFTEKIIQSLIASFPISAKMVYFDELIDVILENKKFSINHMDKIIDELRAFAPDKLKSLNFEKIRQWIENNQSEWEQHYKNSVEIVDVKDKIFYGPDKIPKKSKRVANKE